MNRHPVDSLISLCDWRTASSIILSFRNEVSTACLRERTLPLTDIDVAAKSQYYERMLDGHASFGDPPSRNLHALGTPTLFA